MNNTKFITEFTELLGADDFFLCDRIDQDQLFAMQDGIANLIANASNDGNIMATKMVQLLPNVFKTDLIIE
jgi:hypothetical protein